MGRIVPEVDPALAQGLEQGQINPKRISTRRNLGRIKLPAQLELIAEAKLRRTTTRNFRQDARRLISVMYNLKLPDDRHTLAIKKADIKTKLELRDKIKDRPDHDPDEFKLKEEIDSAQSELQKLITGTLEERKRDWHYYEYDEYASDLYMAVRLAPNYAAVKAVMNEIRALDPGYKPNSILDFGSGMGTTTWAVEETWPKAVGEFMNVELSKDQQHLCEYLLRGGKEFGDALSHVFHRQYLPSSNRVRYDMVVSAFSMLELPNRETRTQTIENLWNKTSDFLVIIERGNEGGFATINEARHLILDLSGHDVTKKLHLASESRPIIGLQAPKCHVLAPCPHEFACPRAMMSDKKRMNICRFKVVFEPLDYGELKGPLINEEFSYVVLRKGPHPSYTEPDISIRWPRIVEPRIKRSKHIHQKICCPNGCLAETVITKSKYGKAAYDLAKASNWGDILPVKVKDTYIRKSSSFNDQ